MQEIWYRDNEMITHTMNNSLAASKRDIIYNSEEDKLVSNHII